MQHNLPPIRVFYPLLQAQYCTDCVLLKPKFIQIALVGLGIHPQNGQRDNFNQEPPCLHTKSFGVPITVKSWSSLTSGILQNFAASNHHSSFMMPAWRLLQWKMTRKKTFKLKTYQIQVRLLSACSSSKQRPNADVTIKTWALGVTKQHIILIELVVCDHEILEIAYICSDEP